MTNKGLFEQYFSTLDFTEDQDGNYLNEDTKTTWQVFQKLQQDFLFILCTRQISQNPYPIRVLPS
ncbi:hypothetical protein RR05_13835, partial [Acinetobacter baumannii]|uniref:hypothetical protein n=1 Tax=Acinetobacter baumannii TaxID=470 RepID=UPI00057FFD3A